MKSIAIDGPAGAGKSSIAKAVAKQLGFIYVDTGALYRSIGLFALRQGTDLNDAQEVEACLRQIVVELKFVDGSQHVFLNREDVSEAIRRPEVSMAASKVSAVPAVRAFLFDLQRDIAQDNDILMDGRDIGTVVLPHANVKIFLTASPEERARRRHLELEQKGMAVDYAALLEEIKERDHNDSTRVAAPLKRADDAVLVDSTAMDLNETIDHITQLITRRLSGEDC